MKLHFFIFVIAGCLISIAAPHTFAQQTSPDASTEKLKFKKFENSGSDCVGKAEEKKLKGADRKQFVSECTRQYVANSNAPARLESKQNREAIVACETQFANLKGTDKWAGQMRVCLDGAVAKRASAKLDK